MQTTFKTKGIFIEEKKMESKQMPRKKIPIAIMPAYVLFF